MSELAAAEIVGFAVGSVRLVALFVTAPVFGAEEVPLRIRLGAAVLVAAALGPVESEAILRAAAEPLALAGLVASEAILGASLGFAARVIFAAFVLAGDFVATEGGLGAARVLDPQTGSTSVAMAALVRRVGLLTYLAIDGHHELLRGVALSYRALPVGGGVEAPAFLALAGLGSAVFHVGALLALPVTVAVFVTNVALGLLARAAPQLNLMTVQLPAHVLLLFALLLLGATPLVEGMAGALADHTARVLAILLPGGG